MDWAQPEETSAMRVVPPAGIEPATKRLQGHGFRHPPQSQNGGSPQHPQRHPQTTATCSMSATTVANRYTVEFWRARHQAGVQRVQIVGILGNTTGIYGTITRVTSLNVFVLFDGMDKAEPFHPADLRPTKN